MKNSMYDYVFKHKTIRAVLRFNARELEDAIQLLATIVNSVQDWDMKRYKCK